MKTLTTKQKIKYLLIIGAVLLVILLVILALYIRKNKNKTYLTYDVEKSVSLEVNSSAGYVVLGNGVFRYSRDGASVIGKDGDALWNVSYSMSSPICDVCGNSAVVADYDAKSMYVFDGTGAAHPITTNFPIEKVTVSEQGVVAVLMDDGTQDYISLYSKDGKCLVEMNTLIANSGFPVDVAISNDGTKVVTAYVEFVNEKLVSQLTFYNFGDIGENYVDGLVGLEKYEETLYADVEFVNNNTCVAFGENGFDIFSMEEIPEKTATVAVNEKITKVTYSKQYIGILAEQQGASRNSLVRLYDTKGNVVDERETTDGYTGFGIYDGEVVLHNELQLYIFRIGGTEKLNTTLAKNVKAIYSVEGGRAYLLVGEAFAERIRLIGDKSKEVQEGQ